MIKRWLFFIYISISLVGCFLIPPENRGSTTIDINGTVNPKFLLLTNSADSDETTLVPSVMASLDSNRIHRRDINIPIIPIPKTRGVDAQVNNYENDVVNSTRSFYISYYDVENSDDENPKYITKNINFKLTSRTTIPNTSDIELFIWVDIDDLENTPPNGAIEHMKDKFDGIFLDETSIFGEHWGEYSSENSWIDPSFRDIHILLTDIDGDKNIDSKDGITYGYFNGNDTIPQDSATNSNQCLNVVIDSYLYFQRYESDDKPRIWSATNLDATAGISTLIHEFQHMIHFYNKSVLQNIFNEKFFNEMFSMVAEDILANKYLTFTYDNAQEDYDSPDYYRIPGFNTNWSAYSSFSWEGDLTSYSTAYTLGSYLLRNYGTDLFKTYIGLDDSGKDGILKALDIVDQGNSHTTETLLHNFGKAILLSSTTDQVVPYQFNNSSEFIMVGDYKVRPINLFNSSYYQTYDSTRNKYIPVPFAPLIISELEDISGDKMLGESNIYVDLSTIGNSSITLSYDNSDLTYEILF